jgi:hypothetical protein
MDTYSDIDRWAHTASDDYREYGCNPDWQKTTNARALLARYVHFLANDDVDCSEAETIYGQIEDLHQDCIDSAPTDKYGDYDGYWVDDVVCVDTAIDAYVAEFAA